MTSLEHEYRVYLLECILSPTEAMIEHELLSFEDFCRKHLVSAQILCYNTVAERNSGGVRVATERLSSTGIGHERQCF